MAADPARLFVALELPEPVRDGLAGWGASLAAADPALRAVRRESLHVTLCFLGARPPGEIDSIIAAIASVVGAAPAGTGSGSGSLCTAGAILLPARRPRVVAVRIEDRSRGLTRLQAGLATRLVALGVLAPEPRAFLPHVTIARVRRGGRAGSARGRPLPWLLAPASFAAAAVTLFRSRPEPGGSVYEPLGSAFLDAPT